MDVRPFVTGAVQPKISQKNLKSFPFIIPTAEVERDFVSRLDLSFNIIRTNSEEGLILATLRDTLLPKLISGELRVPDVEKILEGAP